MSNCWREMLNQENKNSEPVHKAHFAAIYSVRNWINLGLTQGRSLLKKRPQKSHTEEDFIQVKSTKNVKVSRGLPCYRPSDWSEKKMEQRNEIVIHGGGRRCHLQFLHVATKGKTSPESAFYRFESHKRKESLTEFGTVWSMASVLGPGKKKRGGGSFDYRYNF